MAAIVTNVIRLLNDTPYTDTITGAYTAGGSSVTVATDATTRYRAGEYIEFEADGTLEALLVTAVTNTTTLAVTGAQLGTTAANHSNGARFRKNPRFWAKSVERAIQDAIAQDLYPDCFAVYEETLTPTPTTSYWYSVPAESEDCLAVYQKPDSGITDLKFLTGWSQPMYTDSTLSSTKKAMRIPSLYDTDNTLFAQFTRIPAVGDLSEGMLRVVEYGACARLLEWKAGESTKDEDAKQGGWVAPGQLTRDAAWYRAEQDRARRTEKTILDRRYVRRKRAWFGPARSEGIEHPRFVGH